MLIKVKYEFNYETVQLKVNICTCMCKLKFTISHGRMIDKGYKMSNYKLRSGLQTSPSSHVIDSDVLSTRSLTKSHHVNYG